MRVAVAINHIARHEPAVSRAVFSITDVIALVTSVRTARAYDPMRLAASAARRGVAAAPVIAWTGALGIGAIEIRSRGTAAVPGPGAVSDGVTRAKGNPPLARSAGAPVAPKKTIVARARTGVAARRIIAIAHAAKM